MNEACVLQWQSICTRTVVDIILSVPWRGVPRPRAPRSRARAASELRSYEWNPSTALR